jgi:8-oxo-dGTP diphosphatase
VTRVVLVAAAAIFDAQHRVLLAERPAGKSMAGLWEFPGGKVADGETPEAALVRELDEELGITVAPDGLLPLTFASHGYPDFHLLMPLFVVGKWQGTPTPREGQQLRWLRPDAIDAATLPPADVPLLAPLAAFAALRPNLSG